MFSRRVIARCGPPAGVPYNASASFRGTQLPISDVRSTVIICVEVTIRSVFGGLGS